MTQLLTVDEAAALLKCSRRTVFAEIQRGRLRCRHVGRNARITEADLEEYLCANDSGQAALSSVGGTGLTGDGMGSATDSARGRGRRELRRQSSKPGSVATEVTGPDLRDVAARILKGR